jgi:2-dehydro-3-deoxy-D-arabinonate dehydratase
MRGLTRVQHLGREQLAWRSERGTLHVLRTTLAELLAAGADELKRVCAGADKAPTCDEDLEVLAPIDRQEVWASGVTYERSRDARVEEAAVSDPYELVYTASRPELFLKATPGRVPPPGAPLRIRRDSSWDVPEPELALLVTARKEIVGYLVADDLSSRSIEGENPLYLPQAKLYDDSLGLSDTIVLADDFPGDPRAARIDLTITRGDDAVYTGTTSTAAMRRRFEELVKSLFAELSHPYGVLLLTGTGIVPPEGFTLHDGDHVEIEIEGAGRLAHSIYRSPNR